MLSPPWASLRSLAASRRGVGLDGWASSCPAVHRGWHSWQLPRRNDFAHANLVKVSRVLHCTHPPSRLPIAVGSGEQNDSQHVCRPFGRPLRAQVKAGTARGCPVRVRPNVKLRSAPTHRRLLLEIPAKFFCRFRTGGFFRTGCAVE